MRQSKDGACYFPYVCAIYAPFIWWRIERLDQCQHFGPFRVISIHPRSGLPFSTISHKGGVCGENHRCSFRSYRSRGDQRSNRLWRRIRISSASWRNSKANDWGLKKADTIAFALFEAIDSTEMISISLREHSLRPYLGWAYLKNSCHL